MVRNKARDDKHFNCAQEHEGHYVANLYRTVGGYEKVKILLDTACKNNRIDYSTHTEVYKLIKEELGYDIPVGN